MRRILTIILCVLMGVQGTLMFPGEMKVRAEEVATNTEEVPENESENAEAENTPAVEISAPSAILMEASTGQIVYEKDADTKRPPASVTKVMTLLLIFDALADKKITLEDEVTTSEYAASMGGSQVFLEPGEVQTVDTMIKCIAVASANDACVAFKNRRQHVMVDLMSRLKHYCQKPDLCFRGKNVTINKYL